MTKIPNTNDPMMVLIAATHARTQIAMGELSELAGDQQKANELLNELRKVEGKLREMRADRKIEYREIVELRDMAAALTAKGVDLPIATALEELEKGLHYIDSNGDTQLRNAAHDGQYEDSDYLWANKNSEHEHHVKADENLESIKATFEGAKDTVRGEVSNRELDMQRMTQEVSSAMQLQSNLMKRTNDTENAIIGAMRG